MSLRLVLVATVVVTVVATAVHAVPVVAAAPHRPVVVAVIDSGLRATHQEFDYRGPGSRTDQVVAWWDFTSTRGPARSPRPGQLWDDRTKEPYDDFAHGTQVASMAVGRNRDARKSPSAAPGYALAVARVISNGNLVEGDVGAALRWATQTVRADVISISIGTIAAFPSRLVFAEVYAALDAARAAGITVVVANGNGWANVGVLPGEPGWATGYGDSPSVLAVGAATEQGLLLTTDPEVVADHTPTAAGTGSDTAYDAVGGTSFAAPLVAGLAARIVEAARRAGRRATPAQVEALLKATAVDTPVPPTWEGYGELDLRLLPVLLRHATAGTLPARPSPDLNAVYVEQVRATLSQTWARIAPP